jgi:hypothetical protein
LAFPYLGEQKHGQERIRLFLTYLFQPLQVLQKYNTPWLVFSSTNHMN